MRWVWIWTIVFSLFFSIVFSDENAAAVACEDMLMRCVWCRYGMGTSAAKAASNEEFYTRYDPLPGLKVPSLLSRNSKPKM